MLCGNQIIDIEVHKKTNGKQISDAQRAWRLTRAMIDIFVGHTLQRNLSDNTLVHGSRAQPSKTLIHCDQSSSLGFSGFLWNGALVFLIVLSFILLFNRKL